MKRLGGDSDAAPFQPVNLCSIHTVQSYIFWRVQHILQSASASAERCAGLVVLRACRCKLDEQS